MNISIDLGLIFIQCLVLAFFSGQFSQQLKTMGLQLIDMNKKFEKMIETYETKIDKLNLTYFGLKEGFNLEKKVDTLHERVDSHSERLLVTKEEILRAINDHKNGCNGFIPK